MGSRTAFVLHSRSKDPQFKGLSDFVVTRALEDWHYFIGQQGPVDISINLPIGFLEDPHLSAVSAGRFPIIRPSAA
jgi:hypothetical protein